jgi:hypothetical protein
MIYLHFKKVQTSATEGKKLVGQTGIMKTVLWASRNGTTVYFPAKNLSIYLGWTAMATSPSMVSGRVVDTTILSSELTA